MIKKTDNFKFTLLFYRYKCGQHATMEPQYGKYCHLLEMSLPYFHSYSYFISYFHHFLPLSFSSRTSYPPFSSSSAPFSAVCVPFYLFWPHHVLYAFILLGLLL